MENGIHYTLVGDYYFPTCMLADNIVLVLVVGAARQQENIIRHDLGRPSAVRWKSFTVRAER